MTSLLISTRAFHFAGGMVLVGVVAFRWLVLLPAFAGEPEEGWPPFALYFRLLHRLFIGAGIVLLLSGAALFWAVAAGMSDTPLLVSLNRETLSTVLFQTQFGSVFQWRLGLALVLALLIGKLWREQWFLRRRRSIFELLAGVVAVALVVSFAWTGHAAAATSNLVWRISADALHLFASAVWPAGLLPLALFLRHARRMEEPFSTVVIAVALRFSAVSLFAVGLLVVTGLINSFFLVGHFSALWTSVYGRFLSLKIFLFLLMLGFAAWNRSRILPALGRATAAVDQAGLLLRRLQAFVVAELGLAGAIVIVTAILGTTPPPQ